MGNTNNITDPAAFNRVLGGLMERIIAEAVGDPTKGLFASGNVSFNVYNIYGLVQCSRDLISGECSSCLRTLFYRVPVFVSSVGARILSPNCNFRYEIYPFFNATQLKIPGIGKNKPTFKFGYLMMMMDLKLIFY